MTFLQVIAAIISTVVFMLILLEVCESNWPKRTWQWLLETWVVRWLDERP